MTRFLNKDRIYGILGTVVIVVVILAAVTNKTSPGPPLLLPTPGKPIILFFYSPSNIQCREVMPLVQRAAEIYKDSIDIMMVPTNDPGVKKLIDKFKVGVTPETYVIGRDGETLISFIDGPFQWDELKNAVEKALVQTEP